MLWEGRRFSWQSHLRSKMSHRKSCGPSINTSVWLYTCLNVHGMSHPQTFHPQGLKQLSSTYRPDGRIWLERAASKGIPTDSCCLYMGLLFTQVDGGLSYPLQCLWLYDWFWRVSSSETIQLDFSVLGSKGVHIKHQRLILTTVFINIDLDVISSLMSTY